MGVHCGFLVAERPWSTVQDALVSHCGSLTDGEPVDAAGWGAHEPGRDVLFIAEHDGKTHVLDTTMVLTSSADVIPVLSRALDCTVAAAVGESISGTYSLVVAHAGDLRRLYFNIATQFPEPFTKGAPLPAEASRPLEDPDGEGLLACLASLGFSRQALDGSLGGTRVVWSDERIPQPGPLAAELNDYYERFPQDDESWLKSVTAVEREPGRHDIRSVPDQPRSRLRRLFKR